MTQPRTTLPLASRFQPRGLVDGERWHRARPGSRALWTSATETELGELLARVDLRDHLERFLRLVAAVVGDATSLLVFDEACVHLVASVRLRDDGACVWDWPLVSWRAA